MNQLKRMQDEITRFLMVYEFALKEIETKVDILNEEFQLLHAYNPIEHTKSRLKSLESIVRKVQRKGFDLTLDSIRKNITDIAGMRIVCSFISDIYEVSEMLQRQADLKVLKVKDYIKNPKPNGYQSLHILLEVPVFLSDHHVNVPVELQIRTIAMDFWASLEHKIYYKYNEMIPSSLLKELKDAAVTAASLDKQMEYLHYEVSKLKETQPESDAPIAIPAALLELIQK